MSVQAVPFWQSIRNVITGPILFPDDPDQRIRISQGEVRTVPPRVGEIRVFSGGAWVSSPGQNALLYEGQSLKLHNNQGSVAVTSIGRRPVVLELLP